MVTTIPCLLEVEGLPLHHRQVMFPAPQDIKLHHQKPNVVGLGMLGKEVLDICSALAASEQVQHMEVLPRRTKRINLPPCLVLPPGVLWGYRGATTALGPRRRCN